MDTKSAARTVIYDKNKLFALINVKNGEYFKIPGGGIENDETPQQAAIRESIEESGCEIKIIQKIGESEFIDEDKNIIHHSVCFLAEKIKQINNPTFDDWEKSQNMKIIWVDINQSIIFFKNARPKDNFSQKINQRDFEFIIKAKEILNL